MSIDWDDPRLVRREAERILEHIRPDSPEVIRQRRRQIDEAVGAQNRYKIRRAS